MKCTIQERRTRRVERRKHKLNKFEYQVLVVRSNKWLSATIGRFSSSNLKLGSYHQISGGSTKNIKIDVAVPTYFSRQYEQAWSLGKILGEKAKVLGITKGVSNIRWHSYAGKIAAFFDGLRSTNFNI